MINTEVVKIKTEGFWETSTLRTYDYHMILSVKPENGETSFNRIFYIDKGKYMTSLDGDLPHEMTERTIFDYLGVYGFKTEQITRMLQALKERKE